MLINIHTNTHMLVFTSVFLLPMGVDLKLIKINVTTSNRKNI